MARRDRGNGSIYQRADGRWVAALQVDGRRHSVYADTEREAKAKLRALREMAYSSAPEPTGRHTLAQLVEAWLSRDTSLRETTKAAYRSYLRLYILPVLGGVRVTQVTTDRIQGVIAPLTPANAANVATVLHRAFTVALRWRWVRENPVTGVMRPRYEPKPRILWSEADIQAFRAAIEGYWLEPLFILLLSTGLRIGEALALTWDDAGLGVAVNVNGSLYRMHGEARIGEPKTRAGKRTIILPPLAIAALQAQRIQQDAWRETEGARWQSSPFVFTTKSGGPLGRNTPYEALQRYCRQLDLPVINLHGLRHLHASMLMSRNVPIPAISARLGHSNPGITMRVYMHSLAGQDQLAALAIEAALERTTI